MGVISQVNEKALGIAKEAASNASKIDDKEMHLAALHLLAQVELMNNNYDEALKACRDAIAMGKELENQHWEAMSTVLSAEINYLNSKGEQALEAVELGLKICKRNGDFWGAQYAGNVLEMITGVSGGGEAKAVASGDD